MYQLYLNVSSQYIDRTLRLQHIVIMYKNHSFTLYNSKFQLGVEPLVPREFNGHLSLHFMGHELMYVDTEYFDTLGSEPRRGMNSSELSSLLGFILAKCL